ncbi:hypothetical protein [Wolbachia endosymbiont of Tribolium confusum]|uniref:hypothetical protein n=1 Tax=Wolbachia endosymbiont of Tribolium confusum TaxID=214474 RepID=UPI00397C20CD
MTSTNLRYKGRFVPLIDEAVRKRKKQVGSSWRDLHCFKNFHSTKITITGIENVRMIQKKQIIGANDNVSTFENFAMLMAS